MVVVEKFFLDGQEHKPRISILLKLDFFTSVDDEDINDTAASSRPLRVICCPKRYQIRKHLKTR